MSISGCQLDASATVHGLLELLRHRKTRRFGCGMEIPAGPLRYRSEQAPIPLHREELHHLLFAGVGETGPHLADMQYASQAGRGDGQGMAIMNFQGRTAPSTCAANATKLFLSHDDGLYFVSRVPDVESGCGPELVQLQAGRMEIPRALPYMLSFNQWYANRPGTAFLLPVTNVVSVYFNLLLVLLSEDYGYFVVDTDNGNSGCGLDRFRKSRGGHLHDDPAARRMVTLRELDASIAETAIQEQGTICQNMYLMEQALGLGGGIHSVGSGRHLLGLEPAIFPGLGFHFMKSSIPNVRPNPVGLPGVWEAACPPFVESFETSIRSLVESKFGKQGIYTTSEGRPWSEATIGIPPHDSRAIEATIALCDYVFQTYGRFPAHTDAFKTVIAFQAHHVDVGFYDKFYPTSALPEAHRDHLEAWHGHEAWNHPASHFAMERETL